MKTIEITQNRLILTNDEEKSIYRTWKREWSSLSRNDRIYEGSYIILGQWSGYTAGQGRICHVTQAKPFGVTSYYSQILFTDNTRLTVWVERLTREEILRRRLRRMDSYTDLILKAIRSGQEVYTVGSESQAGRCYLHE